MEKHAEIGAGRKRRTRTFINGSAKIKLEDYFQKEPRPSPEALDKLADSVKMNYKVLRIWFCNRRQKEKRMKQPTAVPVIKTQLSSQNLADRDESAEAGKADEDVTDDSLTEDTESSFLQSSTSDEETDTDTSATNESVFIPPAEIASVSDCANAMLVSPDNIPGSSIRNGRPWGPLSRRRPVEEELTENQKASFELPNEVRFADRLLKSSKKIDQYQNHFDVHSVPLVKSDDSRSTFERFSFGNPDQHAEHRAFLVLGSNRLSQAQFINGIVNYIFNVEQNDKFRFQLIKEEEIGAEMNCIKVYDVHHANGFRVPFSITIVALPIYNDDADDSQVLFKFQTTAKMLLEFLEDDGRINKLNMICNLVSDNLYNQSLSILGKDVAGSITDCWEPFNYLDGTCSWHHSLTIQRFFAALTEKNVNSLPLTRQVLKERILLEGKLNTLKSLIEIGCEKMKAIDKAKSTIVFCDSHIELTEDVEENDIQELARKVWLPTGEYAYNCDRCFFTCNNSFVVGEEKDSTSSAHDVFEGKTLSGFCSICPEKCSLKMHFNQHFRWVKQEMKNNSSQSRPSAENKMRWSDMKSISSDQITMLQNHLKENGTTMLKHFHAAWGCLQHLNKNALHGTSFFTKRVFDILNNAEQQLKELGYQEGIDSLRN